LCMTRIRRGRRPDHLWSENPLYLSSGRHFGRKDTQGRQASRFAGRAANPVRARRQSQHRKGARPYRAAIDPRPRRRGHRLNRRELGLVASLARPGGNLTGVTVFVAELVPKRLELLSELVPKARVFALLVNPNNPNTERIIRDVQEAARLKGVQLPILKASTESE